MKVERAIIWPDTHVGIDLNGNLSHDKKAVNLLLDVAKDIKPEYLYIIGDFADFYSVMQHQKDPGVRSMLKDELVLVHDILEDIKNRHAKNREAFPCW